MHQVLAFDGLHSTWSVLLTCVVYLGDIIGFDRTFDEHLLRLREVFGRIRDANRKLKPSKCSLFQRSVYFLGHVVSEAGLSMQNESTEAIRDWPPCRSLTEVRAFMSTFCYYRRFVKYFSSIAASLFGLIKRSRVHLDYRMPGSIRRIENEADFGSDTSFAERQRNLRRGLRRLQFRFRSCVIAGT